VSFTASLGGIAQALVQMSIARTGGTLPIVYEGGGGGNITRAYTARELTTLDAAFSDLIGLGVDIAFEPRLADPTHVEWVMRCGTAADPLLHQTGADWVIDASPVSPDVTGLSVSLDGSGMANIAWAVGETQVVKAGTVPAGSPLLETAVSQTDKSGTDLQRYAAAAVNPVPWATWAANVSPDWGMMPGDWVTVRPPEGDVLWPAARRARITSISATNGAATVAVQCAPTPQDRG
jgi:hypothetical protein